MIGPKSFFLENHIKEMKAVSAGFEYPVDIIDDSIEEGRIILWHMLKGRYGKNEIEIIIRQLRIEIAHVVLNQSIGYLSDIFGPISQPLQFINIPALMCLEK